MYLASLLVIPRLLVTHYWHSIYMARRLFLWPA